MASAAPVLIAGGGIGGLALALALARGGRPAVVLEQRPEFSSAGAGIQLGPNGVRALQQLGVAPRLAPLVGVPEAVHIRAGASGWTLARLPLGPWLAARHGAPYWVAHRHDLHAALLAAAGAEPSIALRTGFTVLDCQASVAGVTAIAASGDRAQGAALVGADGLWSSVRQAIAPTIVPVFVGATATRAVLPATDAGKLATAEVGLWLSGNVHIVHYPVRGGSEIAVVMIAAESWQGRDWDAEADRESVLTRLTGFHAHVTDVLATVPRWRRWALHRLPVLPHWTKGRIALIGDAAHPVLPYLAQGGALALEDAVVMGRRLCRLTGTEEEAFAAFEAERRVRALSVQRASRMQGRVYDLRAPLSWARDAVLRLIPGRRLMAGLDWLYGWRGDDPA